MRTRDHQKQEIVKLKAIALIVEDGLENFSMNKLAKICNISVATLYIYYKDKDDLIIQVAKEAAQKKMEAVLTDFDPALPFEEGLRKQWRSRSSYMLQHPMEGILMEKLRGSAYFDLVYDTMIGDFKRVMGEFMKNVIQNGEMEPLPLEVFWSVAFAPMYNLVRFHNEGKSVGGKPFTLTDEILWQTFDKVIKGLRKEE